MKIYNNCNNNVSFGINSKNLSEITNRLGNKFKRFPSIEDFFVNGETKSVSEKIETEIMEHMEEYARIVDTNERNAIEASKHIFLV